MATASYPHREKSIWTLDISARGRTAITGNEMLMHAVSLENTVRLTTLDRPGIRLNCSNPAVPTGEKNLAYRAARFFAAWGTRSGWKFR